MSMVVIVVAMAARMICENVSPTEHHHGKRHYGGIHGDLTGPPRIDESNARIHESTKTTRR